jgi:hypothetical protein
LLPSCNSEIYQSSRVKSNRARSTTRGILTPTLPVLRRDSFEIAEQTEVLSLFFCLISETFEIRQDCMPDTKVVSIMSGNKKIQCFSLRPQRALREIEVKDLFVTFSFDGKRET